VAIRAVELNSAWPASGNKSPLAELRPVLRQLDLLLDWARSSRPVSARFGLPQVVSKYIGENEKNSIRISSLPLNRGPRF
jgi:hypothetical protein